MLFFKKNILYLILIYYSYNYVVFPFKSFNKCDITKNIPLNSDTKSISNMFINDCLTSSIYSEVKIGSPKQTVNILFSMKGSSFYLFEHFCPDGLTSFYDLDKSTTYRNSSFCTKNFNNIEFICNIKEKITFYNSTNLLSNVTLEDTNIAFGQGLPSYLKNNNKGNDVCGFIGFSLNNRDISNLLNRFLLILKFFKAINDYIWTFHFFDKSNKNDLFYKIKNENNHEGLFIIGLLPHVYDNISFNETFYKSTLNENRGYTFNWDLKFFEIYFYDDNHNKIKINHFFQGNLDIETNYIVATREYFNLIKEIYFNKYIINNICTNETVEVGKNFYSVSNNSYEVISCDIRYFNEKEMEKFPALNFFHLKYNYTFSFDYKELFQNVYNRIFFLIMCSKNADIFWTFGKMFMKKYQFIFDTDKKSISFYNQRKIEINDNMNNNSNKSTKFNFNYVYFFLITIIISILIGILIGRRLFKRHKKIVSELNDGLEYNSIDKKTKKVNQTIEMKSKLII